LKPKESFEQIQFQGKNVDAQDYFSMKYYLNEE